MENVTRVLRKVNNVDKVADYLHLDIIYYHVNNHESNAKSWLEHHPAPSWRCLANALYLAKESEALEFLKSEYYKGECFVIELLLHIANNLYRFSYITSEIQGGHETRAHSLTDQ